MKILVPVKQVTVLAEDFALGQAGTPAAIAALPGNAVTRVLNEWDAHAVQAAIELREQASEGRGETGERVEIIVASVGDEHAEHALRACLAIGADRAIRVSADGLDTNEPLGAAAALAALAKAEAPELILCGAQSADAANGATGVALAGLLEFAHVAIVTAIERDGERLIVQRELAGGAIEVLRLALPALLSVQTSINAPRKATLRQLKQSRAAPISVLTHAELGLDPAAVAASVGARTVRLREREQRGAATRLEGTPGEIATAIAVVVREALSR